MKLLLVGDEQTNRRMVAWGFANGGTVVRTASTRARVAELIELEEFHLACVDLKLQAETGLGVLDFLRHRVPSLPVIALLAPAGRKLAPQLKERGVAAQLVAPFPIEDLAAAVRRHALALPVSARRPAPPAAPADPAPRPTSQDATASRLLELALRAANSNAAILILGETGTGKTQLAQTIHQHSPIRSQAFVTVNCPCLSHELLESDLFGHVRGAFTGAVQDTWGKVAAADGGTLFLDEIGDLPMALQPKLLRLLQEKQYERVGETTPRSANVRIIAATNRDLKREVEAGRFREDLYYRLNVIAIEAPPLRHRPGQIAATAEAFLEAVCRQMGRPSPGFTPAARQLLEGYGWPGNLRELRNVIERAAVLSPGKTLDAADFPALLTQPPELRCQIGARISLQALEMAHIQMVIASTSTLEEAARVLQIDKSTLYRKRKAMEGRVAKFMAPGLEPAVAHAL